MKKKTNKNNLNFILEEMVKEYLGDMSVIPESDKVSEVPEKKIETETIQEEIKNEKVDPSVFIESLREDFFNMLKTTKKIEEKKDLSDQLEDIAKAFFN
jgi:hypothetical protein